MARTLNYKYKYDSLDDLVLKIMTLEDMLNRYKATTAIHIEWETQVYIDNNGLYGYKVRVFEKVDK